MNKSIKDCLVLKAMISFKILKRYESRRAFVRHFLIIKQLDQVSE